MIDKEHSREEVAFGGVSFCFCMVFFPAVGDALRRGRPGSDLAHDTRLAKPRGTRTLAAQLCKIFPKRDRRGEGGELSVHY